MAKFGKQRILGRVVLMLLLIAAITLGGLFWLDFLGVVDAKSLFKPVLGLVKWPTRTGTALPADLPTLLDDERYAKQLEAIALLRQEVAAGDKAVAEKAAAVEAMVQELEERKIALEEKEKSFNSLTERYENRKANVEQNAKYLTGMPPADAVKILGSMDDQTAIDVLRSVEELAAKAGEASVVSYWLSLLPAERAADIQRKMAIKPVEQD